MLLTPYALVVDNVDQPVMLALWNGECSIPQAPPVVSDPAQVLLALTRHNLSEFERPQPCHAQPVSPVITLRVMQRDCIGPPLLLFCSRLTKQC